MERMEQAQITTVGHVEQNWNKIQNQLYTTLVKFNLRKKHTHASKLVVSCHVLTADEYESFFCAIPGPLGKIAVL